MTSDLWVSDHMSTEVVTCSEDTTLAEVIEELRTYSFSCLVVTRGDRPVGIVTERGLLGVMADILGEQDWESLTIDHFMSTPPTTVGCDYTLLEAVTIMRQNKIRHAPVVNLQKELVGILTQKDIINGFYEQAVGEHDTLPIQRLR